MTNVGEAYYEIDARTHKLRDRLNEADDRIRQSGDRAERTFGDRLTSVFGRAGSAIGGVARVALSVGTVGVGALTALGGFAVKNAADMESMSAAWETMLGSAEAAQQRMDELKRFAATTPFEIPEVMAASRTLQVFGGTALATGDSLRLVGDVAAGTQQPFEDVATWFGRMYDAMESGQPFGEAAMRLQEMGAMSGDSRRRIEELAEGVKNGTLTMDEAWAQAQAEFGQFGGMMERQSQTLNGQISNLMDNIGQAMTGIGEILLPVVKGMVEGLNAALPVLKDVFINVFEQAAPIVESIGRVVGEVFDAIVAAFEGGGGAAEGFGALVQNWIGMVQRQIELFGPIVATALGWIAENVLPALIEAFRAVSGWVVENWPMISSIVERAAGIIGSVIAALWPIMEQIARVALPALGAAFELLLPIIDKVLEVVQGAIDFFTDTFVPTFENVGATFGAIWTAVGGFFTDLWNGILRVVGGIVGTIIGIIKNVVSVAAEIPGPWQEGARQQRDALAAMEQQAKTWGQNTTATLTASYEEQRRLAGSYASRTADAWAEGFASRAQAMADAVAAGLQPAHNVLYAMSPPRSPQNPLHDIAKWAAGTADAYGEAFAARSARIAALVGRALEPASGLLQPDVSGTFVGSNETLLDVTVTHRIDDPRGSLASVPGGAEGVARVLQRGTDATGFLRLLRHEVAVR